MKAPKPHGPAPDTLRITLPPEEALRRLLKPAPKTEPKHQPEPR